MFHIALDGPSGAGKSTIARKLAASLKIAYLDTGAMYRAVGLYMLRRGIDPVDRLRVTDALDNITIEVLFVNGRQVVLLNGEDVSEAIRKHEISAAASQVSTIAEVRAQLVNMQREIAKKCSFVLDGRDIGSVVLPQAKYKFFLTASVEVRARRRVLELKEKGQSVDYEQVCHDIEERDKTDITRKNSPLCVSENAIVIDSSRLDIEGVLNLMLSSIHED